MKKFIALLLIFILGTTSIAFAEAKSLSEDIKNDLSKFNIITDFNIQSINRAEATKIILAMMGFNEMEQTNTEFNDVKPEYWASGYINAAYAMGIVNGFGDGSFRPEEKLTNEQFIKMLVCVLGYEPAVHAPYPTGYVMKANSLGLMNGLVIKGGDIAARSDVAVMVYNALDIPLLVQTGFGTNRDYTIMDGKNGIDYRTLRTDLGDDSRKPSK